MVFIAWWLDIYQLVTQHAWIRSRQSDLSKPGCGGYCIHIPNVKTPQNAQSPSTFSERALELRPKFSTALEPRTTWKLCSSMSSLMLICPVPKMTMQRYRNSAVYLQFMAFISSSRNSMAARMSGWRRTPHAYKSHSHSMRCSFHTRRYTHSTSMSWSPGCSHPICCIRRCKTHGRRNSWMSYGLYC